MDDAAGATPEELEALSAAFEEVSDRSWRPVSWAYVDALRAALKASEARVTELEARALPEGAELMRYGQLSGEHEALARTYSAEAEWKPNPAYCPVDMPPSMLNMIVVARRKPAPEPQVRKVRADKVRPGMVLAGRSKEPIGSVLRWADTDGKEHLSFWSGHHGNGAHLTFGHVLSPDEMVDVLAPSADEDGETSA